MSFTMPCERVIWYLLPALRCEMAKALIEQEVPRKKIADMLGVSQAAVSQYTKSKRGDSVKFSKAMKQEIRKAAQRIVKGNQGNSELCILCEFFRSTEGIKLLCKR